MNKIRRIVMSAMLAALVCVATMIIKIQLTPNGYINLGDGVIILSGWMLGPFYGFLSAGIGSMLADLFSGFVLYAPATFVIKGLMAVVAFYVIRKLKSVVIATIIAEMVMISGYYIFEGFIYGFATALTSMPGNAVQSVAGIVVGILLIRVFKKSGIKFDL
ncbi:MAG: ECF transporter S component [Clostridia bacterium]|nr:ECF transporter S component [Clostridia bacterium]